MRWLLPECPFLSPDGEILAIDLVSIAQQVPWRGILRKGFRHLLRLIRPLGSGHQAVVLENLALRQQLAIYKRKQRLPRLMQRDHLFWMALARLWQGWREALLVVHPDTVVRSARALPNALDSAVA